VVLEWICSWFWLKVLLDEIIGKGCLNPVAGKQTHLQQPDAYSPRQWGRAARLIRFELIRHQDLALHGLVGLSGSRHIWKSRRLHPDLRWRLPHR
jgi:hypothetical protein